MIVVSDTSPICYLLLINQIEILRVLYNVVTIPQTVALELSAPDSPPVVKNWIAQPPDWLQIQAIATAQAIELETLDPGEREAILLAEQLKANLVILDDKAARKIAVERGLRIIELLGILKDAARTGLLDLETTFEQLREVGFWVAPSLLERLLTDDYGR
jgi:predicted nucleic acid-binding protein